MRISRYGQPTHRALWRQAVVLALVFGLGGCVSDVEKFYDSQLSLDQPVDWWHQLQGGPIADERPPPPGITDPYPNLARVPAKPVPTDPATRAGLTAQLASQRDSARLLAAQDPVVFPQPSRPAPLPAPAPAPVTSPAATQPATPTGTATAATTDTDTSTMVLEAANTAPAKPASAKVAPTTDPNAPAAFRTLPASAGPVVSGPIPPLPTAAPALPNLPGIPISVPAPVVVRARPETHFAFAPGSSALPASADEALRALAVRAVGGPIAISAGGDALSTAPAAQGAALPLALRRTGAMEAVLIAAGVPSASIRAQALSPGREATARLVE